MDVNIQQTSRRAVVLSYVRMIFFGIGIILAAMVAARLVNGFYPVHKGYIKFCEYMGYLGWCSTLGSLGRSIQTFGGESPPERLDDTLNNFFSILGVFFFVFARELIPAG